MDSVRSPLVSIWIPVYNGAHLISKAIQSSLHQTYKSIEVIVFDDMSTDNVEEVVSLFIQKDKRVKYFKSGRRLGQNKSYPKILDLCRGELAHFLCCDDWLSRNYVEECVKLYLEHPRAGAFMGRVFNVAEKGGKFFFTRESEIKKVKGGIYSRDYFGKNAYKNFITSMIILGTARTKDVREAFYWLNKVIDNPPPEFNSELQAMMQHEYGGEFIYCAKLMAKYDYLCVSDNIAMVKTELPEEHYIMNKGSMKLRKEFGLWPFNKTAKGIIKLYYLSRKLYDVPFKNGWDEYISTMRIFFGEEAIATIIVEAIKQRFSSDFFKGFSLQGDLGILFEDYSFYEKFMSLARSPFRVVKRWLDWLARRFSKEEPTNIYTAKFFLNEQKEFSV